MKTIDLAGNDKILNHLSVNPFTALYNPWLDAAR